MNNGFMCPEYISQDYANSIIDETGRYDMSRFSDEETQVIRTVLKNADRKYPDAYKSVGLYNEIYPVRYKPRYVLLSVLVQKYENSKSAIDQFAVALACIKQGASKRQKALEHLELAMPNLTDSELDGLSRYVLIWEAYYNFSCAYEKEGNYEVALLYDKLTRAIKGFVAPADITHRGDILQKIDIDECVNYYQKLLANSTYSNYCELIKSKLTEAKQKQEKGYVFRAHKRNPSSEDVAFDKSVIEAARKFL